MTEPAYFAWERELYSSALSANAKLVALAVAHHLNWSTRRAFVSQVTLARETSLHRTTVVYALAEAVDAGALVVVQKGGALGAGRKNATEYELGGHMHPIDGDSPAKRRRARKQDSGLTLFDDADADHVAESNTVRDSDHVAESNPTMLPWATPTESLNHVSLRDTPLNPPRAPRARKATWRELTQTEKLDFAEFWGIYPRRAGKIKAQDAWANALHPLGDEPRSARDIIDGARRYARDPNREPQFTAHPTTWLNQGRWDDDPLPARNGKLGTLASEGDEIVRRYAQRVNARTHTEGTPDHELEAQRGRGAMAARRRELPAAAS